MDSLAKRMSEFLPHPLPLPLGTLRRGWGGGEEDLVVKIWQDERKDRTRECRVMRERGWGWGRQRQREGEERGLYSYGLVSKGKIQ